MDLALLSQPALLFIAGTVALCESLAFIGILIPGVALLFALALAAGEQGMSLPPLLLAAFVGAVTGDGLSYLLGRHADTWLRQHWPFNAHPHWHARGERFFRRYGPLSIVLGRFIGPIRPVMPFVAGTFEMPARRYFTFNVLSALGWAPAYVLPGFLIGRSADELLGHWQALFYPALGLVLLLLVATTLHQHLQPGQPLARWGARTLGLKPERLAALLLLASASAGLTGLALIQSLGLAQPWNQHLQQLLLQAAAGARPFWVLVTSMGDGRSLLAAALLLALGLQGIRRSGDGWRLLCLLMLTLALNASLKWLLQIERPDSAPVLADPSFPSGHSSGSFAFFAMLAVLLATGHPVRLRRIYYLLALLPVLTIGLSRILVGAHWPLDVLAAWCEGMMAAAALRLWLLRPERGRQPLDGRDTGLICLAVALLLAALTAWRYGADLARYAVS
ncbi:VTT domain-containing protein [Marinobacterium aestuariivivens]|uniref:VTT domain-containing protein n=1 Tax=Marinobacterium aestuariivivens TaxID=1698799 RepID=A0ABW2A1G3_9GAMM